MSVSFFNLSLFLKLSTKAHFSENVQPIAIADQDYGSLPKSCVVSGWGRYDRDIVYMSAKLREVYVTLSSVTTELRYNDYFYQSEGETGPAPVCIY